MVTRNDMNAGGEKRRDAWHSVCLQGAISAKTGQKMPFFKFFSSFFRNGRKKTVFMSSNIYENVFVGIGNSRPEAGQNRTNNHGMETRAMRKVQEIGQTTAIWCECAGPAEISRVQAMDWNRINKLFHITSQIVKIVKIVKKETPLC